MVAPADWKEVRLGDLLGYEQPTKYLVSSSDYVEGGQVPVLTAGKSFLLGYTDDTDGIYTNLPTIIFDDFTTATQWVDFEFKVKSSACKMLRPKNGSCNPRYVFERLRALNYQTSDHKRHWISVFHSMEMLMPPLKEQEVIAEALSDADAAIESLDALITKKRDVKQGTMQQYAQAERVGPDARMVALGSVVVINKGELITSSTSGEGPYPVIAGGKSPAYFSSKFNRDGLTITISASGANAGYVALRKGKIWASDCSTISEDSSIDMNYLTAQLEVRQEKIYRAQFGGAQPHVRPNDLAPLEICYVPLVQQQEIGRTLRAMDDELEALTEQVSKLRMVKEGMMQDLLTGKVRLL